MSDSPENAASDQLTAAESKVVLGVLKHLSSDIQADFDAIAAELGYKSAEVAKVRWRQVRNKRFPLGERATNAPPGGVDKTSSSKKTPVKVKKAGAGQESPTTTPTTTPKKRGRKSRVESKVDDDDVAVKAEEQVTDEEAEEAEAGSTGGE